MHACIYNSNPLSRFMYNPKVAKLFIIIECCAAVGSLV